MKKLILILFEEKIVIKNLFVWAGNFEIHNELYFILISHINGLLKEKEIVSFLDCKNY